MTRRDFVALAEALKDSKPMKTEKVKTAQWEICVAKIANVCAASNGRFNRDRFHRACGLES